MKLYRVDQSLVSAPLDDLGGEIHRQLDSLDLGPLSGEFAIPAGSRGIDRIPEVIRAVGDWVKARGGVPFVFPSMGSHNGATAEGQREMIESLGITEEAMGMEIRASMDCVKLGSVSTGDVWMDRHAYESDGVIVVNRVKLHTCFAGPVQSGLTKMMVVGMGKIRSARTFHSTPTPKMKDMLLEMGAVILESGKILGGLALLEDGFDQLAEIHAVRPENTLKREPELLERHRRFFPTLPAEDIDMLVVEEIGKVFSGTGMDTNVIGYRGTRHSEDLASPRIGRIAVLGLSPRSKGNAFGIGLADFCTRRLRDAMDEHKTFTNVFTTGDMERMKIPATFDTDEDLVRTVRERFGDSRWMFIPNTLHLGTLYVTADLADELRDHPRCTVAEAPTPLAFTEGRLALPHA